MLAAAYSALCLATATTVSTYKPVATEAWPAGGAKYYLRGTREKFGTRGIQGIELKRPIRRIDEMSETFGNLGIALTRLLQMAWTQLAWAALDPVTAAAPANGH